jgi:hypothetical protein
MRERIHFLIFDNRVKHNTRKLYEKEMLFYIKHFLKYKKEFNMSYFDIIKQSRGIAKEHCKLWLEDRAVHDACKGIRY